MKRITSLLLMLLSSSVVLAQTTISGQVVDENGQAVPGVNIVISSTEGTVSDFDGNFQIVTDQSLPLTLDITAVGFASQQINVADAGAALSIQLMEQTSQLEEIIVAASRTPERIAESPVSVERLSLKDIQNTTAPDFYNSLENLKGVDVNYSAIGFPSINTRGFASFANTRFLQLVDGMDNAAPGLNFSVGNLLGLNQLDVAALELLPGASSALYGANAFNGILFMRSKNPFESEGVSAYAKTGINSSQNNGDNSYYDVAVRAAFKLSEKFAVKFNVSHYQGKEWAATDDRMYVDRVAGQADGTVTRGQNDTFFDAANVYGDEIIQQNVNLQQIFVGGLVQQGLAPAIALTDPSLVPGASLLDSAATIGMDGYTEQQLYNGDATSTKFDASLHYKLSDSVEAIWVSKVGMGNSIYQGASRYILKDFQMQQHKLEIRGDNFFVRGYTTVEDSGNAYDAVATGLAINASQATDWFTTYYGTYIGGVLQAGLSNEAAHANARQTANAGLAQVGTSQFENLFNTVISTPLYAGSKFTDKTSLTHFDANYNFKDKISIAEIQVGGSYRTYSLNSDGSIFTDRGSTIDYSEYGLYIQAQRKFGEKLKFTGSIRYDGAQNFDGNYSPRASFVWTPDEARNHNFRLSYQTGFRYPTTQNQYIGLETPRGILLGSASDNFSRYETTARDNNFPAAALLPSNRPTLTGNDILNNSWTFSSVVKFAQTQNPLDLQKADVALVKPEQVTAYEFGYRGKIGKFYIDASYYANDYDDFITTESVVTPHYGELNFSDATPNAVLTQNPQVPGSTPNAIIAIAQGDFTGTAINTNTDADVKSSGFNLGIDTTLGGFDLGLSWTYAKFEFDQSNNPDFEAGFNTPENTFKLSLGKEDLFKNVGFGINFRHYDSYLWESSFLDGIIPARDLLDAQITYNLNKLSIKVGGSNLLDNEYVSAPGAGTVGSTYFIGLTFQP
ncbi:MAG: TonB-dependent receptor [Flavobacteriaceae bacterium]